MSLLRGIIRSTLYVRVQPNRFLVRHIESGRESSADAVEPFTTRRLIVGEYTPAVDTLRRAMRGLNSGNSYLAAPRTVIHPVAMVEGGLSAVEHRILSEVAEGAGYIKAHVWVGNVLSDSEVLERASAV